MNMNIVQVGLKRIPLLRSGGVLQCLCLFRCAAAQSQEQQHQRGCHENMGNTRNAGNGSVCACGKGCLQCLQNAADKEHDYHKRQCNGVDLAELLEPRLFSQICMEGNGCQNQKQQRTHDQQVQMGKCQCGFACESGKLGEFTIKYAACQTSNGVAECGRNEFLKIHMETLLCVVSQCQEKLPQEQYPGKQQGCPQTSVEKSNEVNGHQ